MLELMIVWFGAMGYSVEVLETEHYTECLPNEIIGAKDFFACHTEFVNYDTKTVYFGSAEVSTDLWKYVGKGGDQMGYNVQQLDNGFDCLPNEIIGSKDTECYTKFVNHDRKAIYFNSAETEPFDLPFYVEGGRLNGEPRSFPQPHRMGLNIFEYTMLKINCNECGYRPTFELLESPINNHHYSSLENTTEMLDLMRVQYNELGYKVVLFPTDEMGCLPNEKISAELSTIRDACFKEVVNYDRKTVYFDEKLVTTNLWEYDIDSWGFNIFEHATLHITTGNFHPYGETYDDPLVINGKHTLVTYWEYLI